MNKFKVAIEGCFYVNDICCGEGPDKLMRCTKKMGFLRDPRGKTHKVSLRRLCRDYSVVPYQPEFQDYDFKKPFAIDEGHGAIHLAMHLYGYTMRDSLTKFLEASKREKQEGN
jgi:hypothetical protein